MLMSDCGLRHEERLPTHRLPSSNHIIRIVTYTMGSPIPKLVLVLLSDLHCPQDVPESH